MLDWIGFGLGFKYIKGPFGFISHKDQKCNLGKVKG